jgi:hypothetical protein
MADSAVIAAHLCDGVEHAVLAAVVDEEGEPMVAGPQLLNKSMSHLLECKMHRTHDGE